MEITFDQYINNPMGEKSSVMTQRGMYKELYSQKLDRILLREGGRIKYTLYTDKDRYFIHLKIPSETVDKFYYDTIIEFYTKDNGIKLSRTLKDYNVKFYSNDPSYVYTFAHAFIKNKIFCEDFVSKMSKESIKKVAFEKNPKNIVGYVKSLFFAYLIMQNYGLFAKIKYEKEGKPFKQKEVLKEVMHADEKIQRRQEAGEELRKKKAAIKKTAITREKNTFSAKSSDRVVNTKLTDTVNRVNKIITVKRTRRK